MDIQIKKATIDNLTDIQKLNLMLFEMEYNDHDKTLNCMWTFGSEGESYFKYRIEGNEGCAFVAIDNNKVVGYLVGGIHSEGLDYRIFNRIAELENMLVLKEYRGADVGTNLYEAFIEWCREQNVKRVKVVASAQNVNAVNFYRKRGFKDYELTLEMDI